VIGWENLEFHELADLFPLMDAVGQSDLADEIERIGYLPDGPIVLYEGKILDGRNRYEACLALHMEGRLPKPPPFVQWPENGVSPLEWVIARNLLRRHLTPSQRAMIAAKLLPRFEEEARQRQERTFRRGDAAPVVEKVPPPERGKARDQAAAVLRVNPHYVQDAKKVLQKDPALAEQVTAGELDLQRAKSILKKQERPEPPPAPALPEPTLARFDVLYVDPPWRYSFSAVDDWAVENSYPTLTEGEICALGTQVARLAKRDAILFLWVPAPKLPEALRVMEAWGFVYKTSAVWIKHRTGAGMGYYVRVDHEFLLIGTRGRFGPPPADRRFSSVVEARKGRHSEKPEEARQLIEQMYPDARRIELFARQERPGWEAWGNEVAPAEKPAAQLTEACEGCGKQFPVIRLSLVGFNPKRPTQEPGRMLCTSCRDPEGEPPGCFSCDDPIPDEDLNVEWEPGEDGNIHYASGVVETPAGEIYCPSCVEESAGGSGFAPVAFDEPE
jgi:N6-adenosine-specific RNA methylase IME4